MEKELNVAPDSEAQKKIRSSKVNDLKGEKP
jgi:hypothetical protein